MERYRSLIIIVGSNQYLLSTEEMDAYKYPLGGFTFVKRKRNQALSDTKHPFQILLSLRTSNPASHILLSHHNHKPRLSSIHLQKSPTQAPTIIT